MTVLYRYTVTMNWGFTPNKSLNVEKDDHPLAFGAPYFETKQNKTVKSNHGLPWFFSSWSGAETRFAWTFARYLAHVNHVFLWMPLRRAILWGWNHQIPMGFDCGSSLCLICDMLVSIFGAAISWFQKGCPGVGFVVQLKLCKQTQQTYFWGTLPLRKEFQGFPNKSNNRQTQSRSVHLGTAGGCQLSIVSKQVRTQPMRLPSPWLVTCANQNKYMVFSGCMMIYDLRWLSLWLWNIYCTQAGSSYFSAIYTML